MSDIFPKWTNRLPLMALIGGAILGVTAVAGSWYYLTPEYSRVGYQPTQPVAFSHAIHAGQLGLDCRYCHSAVDQAAHSNVPPTSTCMNCHLQVKSTSPKLELVRESYETGKPIPWVRVHQTPDYVYFNHSVHVNRGISCVECHGRIDQMEEVYHAKSFSMSFCLECHRNPEKHIRPVEQVYNLGWQPEVAVESDLDGTAFVEALKKEQISKGKELVEHWDVNPPTSCSACHR